MKRTGLIVAAFGLFLFAQVAQADWSPAKRLTWNSGTSTRPAIAVDSLGQLHVVWFDDTPGNNEIYYKKSTDGGTTWLPNQRLTWTSGYSGWPAIAIDSRDNLHIVWEDTTPGNGEICYRQSTDGGATWTPIQRLTWTPNSSEFPAIAVDSSGNPHVVWPDLTPGDYDIYYRNSSDGGVNWLKAKRLTWTSGSSSYPAIAAQFPNSLHVLFSDVTPGNVEIYYKKSTDGGTSWTASQRLTWASGSSFDVDMAIDPFGNLHIVWDDDKPGNYEIYYKKSSDGGATWTASRRLTWASGDSALPAIAVDSSGQVHVVWYDGYVGNCEIFYKNSPDGGISWSKNQRLTWTPAGSLFPELAVDSSDNLHLVWENHAPGNGEIYYRKFVK